MCASVTWFAPVVETRSHLILNLLEISSVIHHLDSLLHKEIKLSVFTALQEAVCTPADLYELLLGFSLCSLL